MAEQSVTLQPGESKVVSFEATPHEARTYQVSVNGLTGSFKAIEAVPELVTFSVIVYNIPSYAAGSYMWFIKYGGKYHGIIDMQAGIWTSISTPITVADVPPVGQLQATLHAGPFKEWTFKASRTFRDGETYLFNLSAEIIEAAAELETTVAEILAAAKLEAEEAKALEAEEAASPWAPTAEEHAAYLETIGEVLTAAGIPVIPGIEGATSMSEILALIQTTTGLENIWEQYAAYENAPRIDTTGLYGEAYTQANMLNMMRQAASSSSLLVRAATTIRLAELQAGLSVETVKQIISRLYAEARADPDSTAAQVRRDYVLHRAAQQAESWAARNPAQVEYLAKARGVTVAEVIAAHAANCARHGGYYQFEPAGYIPPPPYISPEAAQIAAEAEAAQAAEAAAQAAAEAAQRAAGEEAARAAQAEAAAAAERAAAAQAAAEAAAERAAAERAAAEAAAEEEAARAAQEAEARATRIAAEMAAVRAAEAARKAAEEAAAAARAAAAAAEAISAQYAATIADYTDFGGGYGYSDTTGPVTPYGYGW